MRRLPEIYKEVVKTNNNKNVYYSRNESISTNIKKENNKTSSINLENLNDIFKLGKNNYTEKVRIKTKDRVYETRLIRRNNGKILTIDNDIIKESEITSLEIL